MKHLFAAILLLGAAPAAAQTVESASGDWSNIPAMEQRAGATLDANAVAAIIDLIDTGQCTLEGQHHRNVDIDIPFLVLFKDDGSIERLVVHSLGCPRAEGLIAGAVLRLVQSGGFTPPRHRRQGWFRGQVGFGVS